MTKVKLNHIDLGGDLCQLPVDTNLYILVLELPDRGKKDKIYLVKDDAAPEGNVYTEYSYINGLWESLGLHSSSIDVEVPTKLSLLENDEGFVKSTSLGTAAFKDVEDSLPILIEVGDENPTSAWQDVRQFPKRQIMILQNTSISDTAHVNMFFFDEIIGQHYTDSLSSLTYVEAEMIGLNKGDTSNWNNFNSTAYAYYKVSVYQTNDDMGKEFIGSKIIKVISPFDGYPSVMFGVESKNHLNMYIAFEDGYKFPNFD